MSARERFDVVIVGAGPAGIFAALELARSGRAGRLAIVDRGKAIDKRRCPARETHCVGCETCAIMSGWGGAGAFSDGKLTLSAEVGGWLGDYVGRETLDRLLSDADRIWVQFGATEEVHGPDEATAERLCRAATLAEMRLVPMRVRHIGTDRSPAVLQAMHDWLVEHGVEVRLGTEAVRVLVDAGHVVGVELADGSTLLSETVVLAPGRDGADWLAAQARALGIGLASNAVDIGVRVEVPAPVLEPLTEPLYEAKLIYYSKRFGDQVRTFCMNPYGEVTTESYGDIVTVNGHSYAEERTAYTNFAVLVSQTFTHPFNDPITYGQSIARLANLLGGGILVQRLGDLRAGRRSTQKRIAQSVVEPTMPSATPGDLSFVLPYRHLADILEFLDAMDKLAPGVAADGTLLYGVEVKFYSSRLELGADLQTQIAGLYAIGDGAGVTRGLLQSSASGIHAARAILRKA
ncbi:FAD-dependent oxidoreductase [Coriobacteriia bacterium Es71-Z0120]|uniref:NAD(P)/FAD-dependent oxidoreductase n=1 Tax=Parvivirga hydrogeniphila TaxID=2939460 RepID=UPI002260FF03|nr:FAD-dependent oxidoreductase [Parvivirga hydrogeniphila]MCL4078134.1 FAD-dependent oxidoreductase [Parvivirga hydrogeniphila]